MMYIEMRNTTYKKGDNMVNPNPFNDVPYNDLSESDKAHVDAHLDSLDDDNDICLCGKSIDTCPDAYAHISGGF